MIKLTFVFIMVYATCFAQQTTIPIEKLSKPKAPLVQIPSSKIYGQFNIGLEAKSKMPDSLVAFNEHAFLEGVVRAYQDHRPIILSPDMFWTLIAQGFARHVGNNYKELSSKLVGFEGKKNLTIDGEKYHIKLQGFNSDWEKIFPEMNDQIATYTGKKLNNLLTANFSTTTTVSKVVSQIVIMDAFKNYFNYTVSFVGCGLPYVILEGSLKDWEKLRDKTQNLTVYQLDWWTKELLPILNQFIEAKKGSPNIDFWMNTVKQRSEKAPYGPINYIDGWIIKFFPFDSKGRRRQLTSISSSSNLASEIVKVPFVLKDKVSGTEFPMEVWGGFIGLTQNKSDFSLKPTLGWAINNVNVQLTQKAAFNFRQDSLLTIYNQALSAKKNGSDTVTFKVLSDLFVGKSKDDLRSIPQRINVVLHVDHIDEIPEKVFQVQSYESLSLSFRNKIKISERLLKIPIQTLELYGTITNDEKIKIQKMFPNTKIYFAEKSFW